jgi:CRP/FNR family transcriptional regulator
MSRSKGSNTQISVSVSPNELEKIKSLAAGFGLPVADYLRAAGTAALPEEKEPCPDQGEPITGDLALLKKFALLASLNEEELFQSLNRIQVKNFAKNQIVLTHDDANRFMYVILTGRVRIILVNDEGKEIILAIHQSGDYFGEMSLVDGKAASATVVAMEDSTVAIISKDDFYYLLHNQKKILLSLLLTFCQRIRASNTTIEIMSRTCAAQRVRMLLLNLCGRHGKQVAKEVVLSVSLTHQDIANMTGLTRETVSRIVKDLKESEEIIILENKQIRLQESFFDSP